MYMIVFDFLATSSKNINSKTPPSPLVIYSGYTINVVDVDEKKGVGHDGGINAIDHNAKDDDKVTIAIVDKH